jgi:CBS domain containing-hemolysin-like protein
MYIAGLVATFFLSSFFSVVKIIFHTLDRNVVPADNDRLRYIVGKIEDIHKSDSLLGVTVAIGKTLANVAFSIVSFLLIVSLSPDRSTAAAFGLTIAWTVVILSVGAYAVPRSLAMRYALAFAPAVYSLYGFTKAVLVFLSWPVDALQRGLLKLLHYDQRFAFLSEEEKHRMQEGGNDEQALDEEEKEMIHSIFEMGETTVKEIMVPRIDMKALEVNTDFKTVLSTIKQAGHSRIPVYRDNIDSIVGILYAKDILGWLHDNPHGTFHLESLLKKPHFVPNSKMIDDLMRELKKKQVHLAIVVDEYGGTAGLVTMEDILEEIVGEIQDEYDVEEEPIVQISTALYHIDPHMGLDDLMERLDLSLDLEEAEYNTLGGLIYHEFGDVPQEGTEFEFQGLRLRVLEMDGQRIEKVEVEILQTHHQPVDLEKEF